MFLKVKIATALDFTRVQAFSFLSILGREKEILHRFFLNTELKFGCIFRNSLFSRVSATISKFLKTEIMTIRGRAKSVIKDVRMQFVTPLVILPHR